MKKKILIGLACILAVAGCLCGIFYPDSNINNTIGQVQNTVIDEIKAIDETEVIVSEYVKSEVSDTIDVTKNGGDVSTTEIIESDVEEEQEVTDEGVEDMLEIDAQVEQENIAYNGTNTGNGLSLLGAYQGLTYYSQADSRWASVMYSSVKDRSQTMKSSACRTDFCSNGSKF